MKCVLVDSDGDYYSGKGKNDFDCTVDKTTASIDDAAIFDVTYDTGTLSVDPDLPTKGDWELRAVSISLTPPLH